MLTEGLGAAAVLALALGLLLVSALVVCYACVLRQLCCRAAADGKLWPRGCGRGRWRSRVAGSGGGAGGGGSTAGAEDSSRVQQAPTEEHELPLADIYASVFSSRGASPAMGSASARASGSTGDVVAITSST